MTEVRGELIGSYVNVYREHGRSNATAWTGTFVLLDASDSSAKVLRHDGPQFFRLSHVKRYFELSQTRQQYDDRIR